MPISTVRHNYKAHEITIDGVTYVDIHRLMQALTDVYPAGSASIRRLARLGEIPSIRIGNGIRGQKFWFNINQVLKVLEATIRPTVVSEINQVGIPTFKPRLKALKANKVAKVENDYDPFLESLDESKEDPLAGI